MGDQCDLTAEIPGLELRDVETINADGSFLCRVEAQQQRKEGALAGSGWTHQGDDLTGLHPQVEVVQDGGVGCIAKLHMVQFNVAAKLAEIEGGGGVRCFFGFTLDVAQALQ